MILDLSNKGKVKLILYYIKEIIINKSYINSSLIDTVTAFYSYYVMKKNYEFLFDYIDWDEKEIDNTLIEEYDWETAEDTSTTWRIGDGTAATYNYIYHTVAGFTENDTFRSNQIRAGALQRETALELVQRENQSRFDSMLEYCQLIDVNFDDLLRTINRMHRLYEPATG